MAGIGLQALANKIGAELVLTGEQTAETLVHSVATLQDAGKGQIAFLANTKYRGQLAHTTAEAVIVQHADLEHCPCAALVMDNPYLGYAYTAQLLDSTPRVAEDIAPSAVVAADVQLGKGVVIGANAVIESGVILADGVQVGAGCFIGQNVKIGQNSKLWANVTVYHRVQIGENCLFQSGAVIGSDGFGYANDKGKWVRIPQLGSVVVGNNVEVGASTTIDRGALGDTVLEDGVILDNQIQIAHNVVLGSNTAVAACSVVAGSTTIGKNCTLAGLVGINGHIEICDGVVLTGRAMVTNNIREPGVYSSGMPAVSNKEWRKNAVTIRNLNSLNKRVKELEKKQAK